MGVQLYITKKHVYLRKDGYEIIKVRNASVKARGPDGYSLEVTTDRVIVRYETFWERGLDVVDNVIGEHNHLRIRPYMTFRGSCVSLGAPCVLVVLLVCALSTPPHLESRGKKIVYRDTVLSSPNGRHSVYIDSFRPCALRFKHRNVFNLRDKRCVSLSINPSGHLVIDNDEVVSSIPATHMELFDNGVLALMSNSTRVWVIADANVERFKRVRKLEREMDKLYK